MIAGMCAVGMIAIWGQSQVADIDATNTLAAVVTAFCGIELFIASDSVSLGWTLAAGLLMAATLLTKGPGALPLIVGVWLWCRRTAIRGRHPLAKWEWAYWTPLLIGATTFAIYAFAVKYSLQAHGMELDPDGLKEGGKRLYPHSFGELCKSIFVFLPSLFLYILPTSLAMPLVFDMSLCNLLSTRQHRIARAWWRQC